MRVEMENKNKFSKKCLFMPLKAPNRTVGEFLAKKMFYLQYLRALYFP